MRSAWPVLAAIALGVAVAPALQSAYRSWAADRLAEIERGTPVVTMSGTLIERDGDAVLLHITGTKHRNCRYVGLQAYALDVTGVRHDANIQRQDHESRGDTKPPGVYDIGYWRVWPVDPIAARVLVYAEHDCRGISVRSIIAEVRFD